MRRTVSSLLVAAGLGAGSLAFGGVGAAATPACPTYPAIVCAQPAASPSDGGLTSQPAAAPAVQTAAATSSASLAFTGADVAGTAVGGAVVIVVGAGLVRVSRRRRG